MSKLSLYPDQITAVERIVTEPTKAALLAATMGYGKTLVAVEAVRRMQVKHPTVLIVCPLATRVSWERTFTNQGLTVPIHRINSTKAGKAALGQLKAGTKGVYLIGREYFRTMKWATYKKVGILIVDEVQIFSNRNSAGIKALKSLKPEWKLAMSGTPWGNKFENAWTIAQWLWGSPIVSSRFWGDEQQGISGFVADFCEVEPTYLKGRVVMKIVGEKEGVSFVNTLPCYIRPEVSPHPVQRDQLYVELTPTQRKMYDHFEEKSYVWLGDKALVEDVPIVERIRLREMALGTVEIDDSGSVVFTDDMKSAKVDALKEFLGTVPEENVLILTHSKKFAKIVANRIPNSRLWTGDTPHDVREQYIQTFGTDFQYLIATAQALEAGVDGLQENCSTLVWLSRTENNMLNEQVEKRIARKLEGYVTTCSVSILSLQTHWMNLF